jgi:hypothetical protein
MSAVADENTLFEFHQLKTEEMKAKKSKLKNSVPKNAFVYIQNVSSSKWLDFTSTLDDSVAKNKVIFFILFNFI